MRTLALWCLLALVPLGGCVSGGAVPADRTPRDRDRINREQLDALPSLTALEAVERYHRDWLRGRAGTISSPTGRTYPHVFVDGRPFGTMDTLAQFSTVEVEEIRFFSAADATTRYGTGYPAGIIEIILRGVSPAFSC